jgi:hypothetical protein
MAYVGGAASTPEGRLEVWTDMVDVSTMSGPDKGWRFTDAHGHEHRYVEAAWPYPTLTEVIDATYWCADCHDEHEDAHLECRICGEHIRPGLRGPRTESVPGRKEWLLDGRPISRERGEALLAEMTREADRLQRAESERRVLGSLGYPDAFGSEEEG